MAKKIYVVRKGRTLGVYETWAECEAQVKGFSGAEYKAFPSVDDAQAWLDDALVPLAEAMRADTSSPETLVPQKATSSKVTPDYMPPWDLEHVESEAEGIVKTAPPEALLAPTQKSECPTIDYRQQLIDKAAAFIAYLQEQGVPAFAATGGSEYHERIGIDGGGWIDLYHTRRKPFKPAPGRFPDNTRRDQVMELWQRFHWSSNKEPDEQHDIWSTVDHYYTLLKPYSHLRFDFFVLARALQAATPDAPPPERVRFDFAQIESIYHQLRPQKP